ncbi:MAG TPA: hypothetical protein VMJ93_09365 [Verrucomicrobiae bacterium]|nr:hypothetical protein [Verrucomicrobiae bacterium]
MAVRIDVTLPFAPTRAVAPLLVVTVLVGGCAAPGAPVLPADVVPPLAPPVVSPVLAEVVVAWLPPVVVTPP